MQRSSNPRQLAAVIQEVDMKEAQSKLSRRNVFAGAGAAGALAVVATVVPRAPQVAAVASKPEALRQEGGYQETAHVQHYYRTARV
jgi:hypothetical protein